MNTNTLEIGPIKRAMKISEIAWATTHLSSTIVQLIGKPIKIKNSNHLNLASGDFAKFTKTKQNKTQQRNMCAGNAGIWRTIELDGNAWRATKCSEFGKNPSHSTIKHAINIIIVIFTHIPFGEIFPTIKSCVNDHLMRYLSANCHSLFPRTDHVNRFPMLSVIALNCNCYRFACVKKIMIKHP